jgi:hypothetical protein
LAGSRVPSAFFATITSILCFSILIVLNFFCLCYPASNDWEASSILKDAIDRTSCANSQDFWLVAVFFR